MKMPKLAVGTRDGRPSNAVLYFADKPHHEVAQFFHDGTTENKAGLDLARSMAVACNIHEDLMVLLKEGQALTALIVPQNEFQAHRVNNFLDDARKAIAEAERKTT